MNNEPVAWMMKSNDPDYVSDYIMFKTPERKDKISHHVIPLYTHPVKELNDGGEPVKNATYWKRQYNLMATQNDNLKSGLYHANEQIKYLESHPVKDREKDRLRFSDEAFNRWLDDCISDSGHTVYDFVENVCEAWHGWENSRYYTHPVKELTDEEIIKTMVQFDVYSNDDHCLIEAGRAILRKASEK